MIQQLLFVCIALIIPASVHTYCFAETSHFGSVFCNKHFVLKATITGKGTEYDKYWGQDRTAYTFKTHNVLRTSSRFLKLTNNLTTLNQFKLFPNIFECGVHFTKGVKYLIVGRIRRGKLTVEQWNHYMPWAETSPLQIQLYQRGCSECYIQFCLTEKCRKWSHDNRCYWEQPVLTTSPKVDECYIKYGACVKNQYGKCRWRDHTQRGKLRACVRNPPLNYTDPLYG